MYLDQCRKEFKNVILDKQLCTIKESLFNPTLKVFKSGACDRVTCDIIKVLEYAKNCNVFDV